MPDITACRLQTAILAFLALLFSCVSLAAETRPNVVASIKPIHSLVAGVMEGVGEPEIIVDGAASPHAYAMRPSQAAMLQDADLVFWVGSNLETFLVKPIETLGPGRSVPLMEADQAPAHEEAGHDHGEAQAGHGGHDDEVPMDAGTAEGDKDADEHGHTHEGGDPHVWLDPVEAGHMVEKIAAALVEADPDNAPAYEANAEKLQLRLTQLIRDIQTTIAPVESVPFVVFHSAYEHFSERFGIAPVAAVTLSADRAPSAAHVAEVKALIETTQAVCVFAEPQFEPKLVDVLIEGTKAREAVLDPLGASLVDGPELYFQLMTNLAGSLKACLS